MQSQKGKKDMIKGLVWARAGSLAKSIAFIFSLFGFILEKETGVVWQALL